MKLTANFDTASLLASDNIAEMLDEADRKKLGSDVVHDYQLDRDSRQDWEARIEKAMKLALQVYEQKTFPWPNAANIKFPLITIAALQYHARSYPALIPSTGIVKCRVLGDDPEGKLTKRAKNIETHMSYQILEEDENWEDQHDRVLITQPIVGCAFKKTYYDPLKGHNVSENILAKDLVVSYYTKSLETAPRITHVLEFSRNDIYERVVRGLFLDLELSVSTAPSDNQLKITRDKTQGVTEPLNDPDKPYTVLEQHLLLDLDGDGYEEPYIAFVDLQSKALLRLVARYFPSGIERNNKGEIVRIKGENYFTKYSFIPSPDGGFYDIGFGVLLGPLNDSINTILNQLIDAGTMSNTAGGFLSRGIKIRSGTTSFQPNEWKQVESTGDDLRKGIMPLPVREPSNVLFTLLGLLINYGERIGGAVDIMVGENPGQNTPAETSRTMAEQGMKIFSGIFKRTYRSQKEEFRKQFRLNQLYLTDKVSLGSIVISPEDYNGSPRDIIPAADPNMVTDSQKVLQAQALLALSQQSSGFNTYEVQKRYLKAIKVDDIDIILPDPKGPNAIPAPEHPKVQEAKIKIQPKMAELQAKYQLEFKKLEEEAQLNQAKIIELEAKAMLALEQADGVQSGHEIAAFEAQIGLLKLHQERLSSHMKFLTDMKKMQQEGASPEGD